ncbi:hypothetical protein DFH07DRAFT_853132 [Mycena maculata]|uniref:Uncharacterized protein n=1 Tax=Mycena maculata TaxID=230809 RepID=A0AAD7HQY5_9AGAR|nr:hypothetical protein DFH07DRAFT_853132 [Mycena maculata]
MSLSLISVNLTTLALSTLIYGAYAVLFFISMYLLVGKYDSTHTSHKSRQDGSIFKSLVFVSAILLFITVTAHWITLVYRAFLAFVVLQDGTEAEIFFGDQTQPSAVVSNSILALAILIGDAVIIYRLWVVWSYNKLVLVVPAFTLFAFTIVSSVSTYTTWRNSDVFANPWLKIDTVLTLITNVYCTAFIAWKIWTITRITMPSDGSNLRHFLIIVVESAGFYALWAVLFVIAYEFKSNLQLTIILTSPAVVGLVNALIQTRVGLGWTSEQTKVMPWPASPLCFAARVNDQV